jgi:hypothetical protein
LLGLSFPLNGVVYLGSIAVVGMLFLLFRRPREAALFLVPAVALAAPVAVLLSSGDRPSLHIGYLAIPLSFATFYQFWVLNLGLLLLLVGVAIVLGNNEDRKLLLAFSAPFIAGNLVQLGPDLGGINHKLFNLWIVLIVVYGAVALWRIGSIRARSRWLRPLAPLLAAALVPPLIFSGIIDVMVVKNERHADVTGTNRPAMEWLAINTPAKAVFLTSADLFMPPSYAGRILYIGIPVFTGTAGYDVDSRLLTAREIYGGSDAGVVCAHLRAEGIDYVQLGPSELHRDSPLRVNQVLWTQFRPIYDAQTPYGPLRYYRVADNCPA